MTTLISRRATLMGIAAGALGHGALGFPARAAGSGVVAQDLGAGLTLFTGAGGNVVAHEGPDSVALIDGGAPEHADRLLAAIAERFGGRPVAALVNTHWHSEQTGANDALGGRGVPIVAHENTRRWMMREIEPRWGAPAIAPRDPAALPTRTVWLSDTLAHGGLDIPLVHTPRAHTDGDIHAVFAGANVIVAGGIACARTRWPALDTNTGGWIGEMLDAQRTLLARADDSTIIVPAEGPPVTRDDLAAQEEMLATMLGRFQAYSRAGKGSEEMLGEGAADEFAADRGDPTEFILSAWDGLGDHMRGLGAF